MRDTCQKELVLVLFIAAAVLLSSFGTCYCREGKHWRQSKSHRPSGLGKRGKVGHQRHRHVVPDLNGEGPQGTYETAATLMESQASSSSTTFNVLDYGAKGDGQTDDTEVSIPAESPPSWKRNEMQSPIIRLWINLAIIPFCFLHAVECLMLSTVSERMLSKHFVGH